MAERFVFKFFSTGGQGTKNKESPNDGENHKLGDAQVTPLDPYNSRFANFQILFFEQHKISHQLGVSVSLLFMFFYILILYPRPPSIKFFVSIKHIKRKGKR
jgi:hypothetical protein